MLTKLERKLLRICNKSSKAIIETTDMQKCAPKLSDFDISQCCATLHKSGYFEIYSCDLGGQVKVMLSYKGKHYKEISWLEAKDFLFKSVLVPIGVSIVTTAIINLLFT